PRAAPYSGDAHGWPTISVAPGTAWITMEFVLSESPLRCRRPALFIDPDRFRHCRACGQPSRAPLCRRCHFSHLLYNAALYGLLGAAAIAATVGVVLGLAALSR